MSKILGWLCFECIIVKKLKTIFIKHICMFLLSFEKNHSDYLSSEKYTDIIKEPKSKIRQSIKYIVLILKEIRYNDNKN